MAEEPINPAYLYALAASNRLTDARTELERLRFVTPRERRGEVADLYNRVCLVQSAVEKFIEQIATRTEEGA